METGKKFDLKKLAPLEKPGVTALMAKRGRFRVHIIRQGYRDRHGLRFLVCAGYGNAMVNCGFIMPDGELHWRSNYSFAVLEWLLKAEPKAGVPRSGPGSRSYYRSLDDIHERVQAVRNIKPRK